jgi:hypothetical protein
MNTPLATDPGWSAEECEYEGHSDACHPKGFPPPDMDVNAVQWTPSEMVADFEPLFLK